MRGEVVTRITFGYEGTQLNIFNGHLLTANTLRQYLLQFYVAWLMSQSLYALHLKFVQIVVKSLQHTIERYLGCVRNEREHRMHYIVVDGFQNRLYQLLAKQLTLAVNIDITTTTKVDALKRAGFLLLGLDNLT